MCPPWFVNQSKSQFEGRCWFEERARPKWFKICEGPVDSTLKARDKYAQTNKKGYCVRTAHIFACQTEKYRGKVPVSYIKYRSDSNTIQRSPYITSPARCKDPRLEHPLEFVRAFCRTWQIISMRTVNCIHDNQFRDLRSQYEFERP
jgi:hypothetical protein